MRLASILLVASLTGACGKASAPPDHEREVADVSLVQLIVNPNDFRGPVRVAGHCAQVDGRHWLFLNREDIAYRNTLNAVLLDSATVPAACAGYVRVSGMFEYLNQYNGQIITDSIVSVTPTTHE